MSITAFDQIKSLYEQELYSNVVVLANLLLTVSEHNTELLNTTSKYQMYVYYGDSLFHLGQYRKAEAIYKQALQFKKTFLKSKTNAKPNETAVKDFMSDTDIKYQMHLCHVKLHHSDQAIDALQSIPGKQRDAKINMALAKLYHQSGMERSAITAYKEVLKECPMALEAAEGLLNLGVTGAEVGSLVIETNITGLEWYTTWIKAQAFAHTKDYTQAITAYKQLEERSPLRGNHMLLVNLGEAYYYIGDSRNAIQALHRARAVDPTMQRGLDVLAALLANERRICELERLVPVFRVNAEYGPEVWTALAYLLYANGNLSRAIYLVQKACFINPKSVEAFILKGTILYDLKKYQDAVTHFREAFQLAPHRFEPHKGLVMCYMAMHRIREAATIASNAYKQLGNAPRALTLYASALMRDPMTVCKAKSLLEKALTVDETHHPAVFLLTEILEEEMSLDVAVNLLEKQITVNPTSKLHQMLGDVYARLCDETRAFEHYHYSLNMDPNNRRALEGMQRLHASNLISTGSGSSRSDPSFYNNISDLDLPETTFEANQDPLHDSDHEASSEISVD